MRLSTDCRIEDVVVEGIDTRDYPDFCDAFISAATIEGRPATDRELDILNDDKEFVQQQVLEHLQS